MLLCLTNQQRGNISQHRLSSRTPSAASSSLNPRFEKVARPLTDKGEGSYWAVNDSVDPRTGAHRIRRIQEE